MQLVFSTALAVYIFDCAQGLLSRVLSPGSQEYYGISACPQGIVFSNSGFDNSTLISHADYLDEPKGYITMVNAQGCSVLGSELLQPHQIECYGNWILCANSGRNSITVINPDSTIVHHYPTRSRFDILPDGSKANHFNSVHVRNEVVYVVAHNYLMPSTVWLFSWPDFVLINVIGTNTYTAHNVMQNEDDLLICNSGSCAIYSVAEKRDIWTLASDEFITRGLAATPEFLFVGLTAKVSRGDRKNCDAGICVLDRKNMQLVERYYFEGIGGIHEIRLLDQEDECHSGSIIAANYLPRIPC